MNPDLTASHHFTATPSVQATVISSAEYLDNLLSWSVCFSPRMCSLQPDLAPCGLHDFIHCPPFPHPVPAMGRSSNIPSILSPYGLGTWCSLCPEHFFPTFASWLLPYSFKALLNASRDQRGLSRPVYIKGQIPTQYSIAPLAQFLFYFLHSTYYHPTYIDLLVCCQNLFH